VHLELVDAYALQRGGIGRVVDLGSDPERVRTLAGAARSDLALPAVMYAGAFLTAPGGYPSDRSWASPSSIREIPSVDAAQRAVDEMQAAGTSLIKVALNAEAGPTPDDDVLEALVQRTHRHGLRVVAHAQGPGQAQRAFEAGVDGLAHTPWTERLDDELVRAMARRMSWTSTLDIHGYGARTAGQDRALDNARRFVAAGGSLRYGTDQGNGPLPAGVDGRELSALVAAGLDTVALLVSAITADIAQDCRTPRLTFITDPVPTDAESAVPWLTGASVLTPHSIQELLT
jgi:hypothetical protein